MDNNQHIPQATELPRVTKETKNKMFGLADICYAVYIKLGSV